MSPKADESGLFYVDGKGKLTTAENAVAQYTEDDARRLGFLNEEKATAPAENKAVTGPPENKAAPVATARGLATADTRKRR